MPDDAVLSSTHLHDLPISEAAPLIEQRRLSPVELTQAYLDRIETFDPQLNAYLLVTADRALEQARTAEAEIAAGQYSLKNMQSGDQQRVTRDELLGKVRQPST